MKRFLLLISIVITMHIFVNGQNAWTTQSQSYYLSGISFTSNTTGYICGSAGTLKKTIDGGDSWGNMTSDVSSGLYDILFITADTGFICGEGGVIRATYDGGTSWTTPFSTGITSSLFDISHSAADMVYFIGENGRLFKFNRHTHNYEPLNTGVLGWSVFFTDYTTGYVSTYEGIIKTINGSGSWSSLITIASGVDFYSIYFTDANTGYVVGDNGLIYKTTNAGTNWSPQSSGTTQTLYDIKFLDNNVGYIVGEGGIILKTEDGGTNWFFANNGTQTSQTLNAVCFTDYNRGFVCGDTYPSGGVVLKTTSGGAVPYLNPSTTSLTIGAYASSIADFDIDANTTWSVSSDQTWLTLNPMYGINNGTVDLTADENFDPFTRAANVTITGGGLTQTVVVTQDASSSISELMMAGIKLYPVPAYDKIFIEQNSAKVIKILIIDALGKVIKEIESEKIKEEINISDFNTGIYFVKIILEDKSYLKGIIIK